MTLSSSTQVGSAIITVHPVPPTVSVYSPSQGATDVPTTTNIVLTFDKNIQAGIGNIVLTPSSGNPLLIWVGDATFSATSVTINPSYSLSMGLQYDVTMALGVIKDASGTPFAGLTGTTYRFTVIDMLTTACASGRGDGAMCSTAPSPPPIVHIGSGSGPCTYMVTDYSCADGDCVTWLKTLGNHGECGPQLVERSITMKVQIERVMAMM